MAKRPPPPEESAGGAPKWMVTFSDCMTLLLTFFVLLLTFSSFDDKAFKKMTTSLSTALPSIAETKRRDSLNQADPVIFQPDRARGSEKADPDGNQEGQIEEGQAFLDFEQRRVYVVSSDTLFLGLGAELSREGKELLADFAFVAQDMANPIVISEHRQPAPMGGDRLGLRRAWALVRHLTESESLDRRRFAVSSSATVPTENIPPATMNDGQDRIVEITLLDRSVTQ